MDRFRFYYRLILLPSFVGLICCACSSTSNTAPDSQLSDSPPDTTGQPAESGRPASGPISGPASGQTGASQREAGQTPSAMAPFVESGSTDARFAEATITVSADIARDVEAYQEGIRLGSSAQVLTQSAMSLDDWGLIASRWQRAADSLSQVSADAENYASAQQKAVEYAANAASAMDEIAQLQAPVYVPLPERAPNRPAVAQPLPVAVSSSSYDRVQVPIVRRLHGTPVVQVTFNRARTYEMILDTGASRTLITRQMADDLGVVVSERMMAATASQAEVSFDVGQVSSIAMGDVVLSNARVSIGDSVSIGLLGNDFLRDYDVTIRTQDGIVELVRS